MTATDFPEAAHARHSSARKGEVTAKETFNPINFSGARRSASSSSFPSSLWESSVRPPSPPVPRVCHSLAPGQRQRPRTEPAPPRVLQWEAPVSTRETSGPDAPAGAGLCVPRTVGASGRGRGVLQRFWISLHEVHGELCAPKGLMRAICLLER